MINLDWIESEGIMRIIKREVKNRVPNTSIHFPNIAGKYKVQPLGGERLRKGNKKGYSTVGVSRKSGCKWRAGEGKTKE